VKSVNRRLVALSTHSTSAGQRFRIETWAPCLAQHGISTEMICFASPRFEQLLPQPGHTLEKTWAAVRSMAAYPSHARGVRGSDAVLVYREAMPVGPPMWEEWLARRRPLAFDIDDPLFVPSQSAANPIAARLRPSDKWKRLVTAARVTICINELIADYVRPWARSVEIVPNAIDLTRYPTRAGARESSRPVIGFSGSHSTVRQLDVVREALQRVSKEVAFELQVMGGPPPFALAGAPVVEKEWSPALELIHLHGFDIGIAPAPFDAWNRYKYFVKVLLYMAVGLPVVASAIGSPTQIIQNGENGFLASSTEEWCEHLIRLVRDPALRARVGAAARKTIEEGYSLSAQLPRVLRIFSSLTGMS
jgi:glycosyltransferase involved in cell wall biosynthesis